MGLLEINTSETAKRLKAKKDKLSKKAIGSPAQKTPPYHAFKHLWKAAKIEAIKESYRFIVNHHFISNLFSFRMGHERRLKFS